MPQQTFQIAAGAELEPVWLLGHSVTISAGNAAATYNDDDYLKAAGDALKPVLTPTSDPGGRFWISARNSTSFTVTREGTLTNAVTFDIRFQ
jgi:hypothetical protein